MNYRFFTAFVCYIICSASYSFADSTEYAYSKIPQSLFSNADAVVRDYNMHIAVMGAGEVDITEDYVITVLNENGKKFAEMEELSDDFNGIKIVDGWLYNRNGSLIRALSKNDIREKLISGRANFYDNERYKIYGFDFGEYPYTCKYHIERNTNYTFFLPSWSPQPAINCAVEKAALNVDYPLAIGLRFRTFNIQKNPNTSPRSLILSLTDIHAQKEEDKFAAHLSTSSPVVILAADNFALGTVAGNMSTWQNLSKFGYELNKNRDELPDDVKKVVHSLTDTCHSPYKKIDLLYEYLKKNTRYLSIQLGIGGWQTFDAKYVASKGYGDCKALSNYMKALLKEAGITSYQALVNAGQDESYEPEKIFPLTHFNHVILCIPLTADSVWVECTAKDLPAGYLSSFTSNRNVLLLTPDGSDLVQTPSYNSSESYEHRKAEIHIDSNINIKGSIDIACSGSFWDAEKRHISNKTKTEIEDHLNKEFDLPDYTINNYGFTDEKNGKIPVLHEHLNIEGIANASHSGKRLFIATSMLLLKIEKPSSYEMRTDSFKIRHGYSITDTLIFNVQGNYTSEYIPEDVNMDFPFASYSTKYRFENNTLQLTINYQQKTGIYSPALFENYIQLYKAINYRDNNDKVVLVKKE